MEIGSNRFRGEPRRRRLQPGGQGEARPIALARVHDYIRSNGIEHDVARTLEQLRLRFNAPGEVVRPKEMPRPPMAFIEAPHIRSQETLHSTREIRFRRAREKVKVIRHERIRVNQPYLRKDFSREEPEELIAIVPVDERRLSITSAAADVPDGTGFFISVFSRHCACGENPPRGQVGSAV